MKGAAALFVLAGCGATLALAQSPAAKPDTAKRRTTPAQVRAAGQGKDGNSPPPANPKLSGQIPEYMVKQLGNFKGNTERKNPIMAGMAAPLSVEEMRSIAAH